MNRARLVRLIGRWLLVMPERTTPRPSERATLRQAVGPRNGGSRLFSVAPSRALYIAKQNSRLPPSSAALRPLRWAPRCRPSAPAAFSSPRRPRWARPIWQGNFHDDRSRRTDAQSAHDISNRSCPHSSSNSTAIAPSRTNPTPDRCRKRAPSPTPSPISSMP